MPPGKANGRRPWLGRILRGCRGALLGLLLLLLGGFLYLNQAGVPGFLKRRLVAELRARGIQIEFSRLRFRWYRGLVAERVSLGGLDTATTPQLLLGELAFQFDPAALGRLQLRVNALDLRRGRLVLPLVSSNEPVRRLIVDHVDARLRLLPDDEWQLDQFTADCLGARLELTGTLTNASALRAMEPPHLAGSQRELWQRPLRRFADAVQAMRFGTPPKLQIQVRADAGAPADSTATAQFTAENADTSWGSVERLVAVARLNQPTGSNEVGRSELRLRAERVQTPWSSVKGGEFNVVWLSTLTNPTPVSVNSQVHLDDLKTPWGETHRLEITAAGQPETDDPSLLRSELRLTADTLLAGLGRARTNWLAARLVHDTKSLIPLRGEWEWQIREPQSSAAGAEEIRLTGALSRATDRARHADASWAWWGMVEPIRLTWRTEVTRLSVTNVTCDRIAFAGSWDAPHLEIRELQAALYGRHLAGSADVNVASRQLSGQADFDFDVRQIESLLTPRVRHWLAQYGWQKPPRINANFSLILPAWTNAHPDWHGEVAPTLALTGSLAAEHATFRGVGMDTVRFDFGFSNAVWHLADFAATAPEGNLQFVYDEDTRTHDYRFVGTACLHPAALTPLLREEALRGLDLFHFNDPPRVTGEIRGRWKAPRQTRFRARVDASRFTFRDLPVDEFGAQLEFADHRLIATDVRLTHAAEQATADGVGFDLDENLLALTNVVSTLPVAAVTHAIGPKTEQILSPYTFSQPPHALVNGWVNVRHTRQAHLQFDLAGGPFRYWRFNVPQLRAVLQWEGQDLAITNLQAAFYGGDLDGHLNFSFRDDGGADFGFVTHVFNVNFHRLMEDLHAPTNQLEGTLGGDLIITRADTEDWGSWQGYGHCSLHDGFLWDIPLFGVFSRPLDRMMPGMGKSRVSGLTATFGITNSLIHTDDLELRSSAARLQYRGTFDFQGNVNAHVEARPLRDMWIVGPLISFVAKPLTKLFEYKVSGTLARPEMEPLYFPKPLLFPLNPIGTLREMFGPGKPESPERESPAR